MAKENIEPTAATASDGEGPTAEAAALPLVAILRGVQPQEVEDIGEALLESGFNTIEVPLNSPDPLESIYRLATRFADQAVIGAGTVLSPAAVGEVADAGGQLIVMPHSDATVIREAKSRGLGCMPGVATPTEAFAALENGADALKAFPAEILPPSAIKAWLAVLPPNTGVFPVGGIGPAKMQGYLAAGARGFGLGSALYKTGQTARETARKARAFVAAWNKATD